MLKIQNRRSFRSQANAKRRCTDLPWRHLECHESIKRFVPKKLIADWNVKECALHLLTHRTVCFTIIAGSTQITLPKPGSSWLSFCLRTINSLPKFSRQHDWKATYLGSEAGV